MFDAAHVDRGRDDRHRPVGVHAADGRGRLGSPGPVAGGDADAFAVGQRVALLPERMLAHALEHVDRADRRERAAADADVALDDRVLQPQLERVELELVRELVEQRLEREGRGRGARAAVGAEREAVRLDAVPAEVVRLPAVRPGDEERRDPLDAPAGVRAAVDDHARRDRGQRAVPAPADRHLA